MQTGSHSGGIWSLATSYGGVSSLFRGMAAPLSTACVVNAIIFSSYGWSSRLFDEHVEMPTTNAAHDSTIKAFTCGSFAGLVQGLVICPMEHLKCRLQVKHAKGGTGVFYTGPVHVARSIYSGYGVTGMCLHFRVALLNVTALTNCLLSTRAVPWLVCYSVARSPSIWRLFCSL